MSKKKEKEEEEENWGNTHMSSVLDFSKRKGDVVLQWMIQAKELEGYCSSVSSCMKHDLGVRRNASDLATLGV